MERRSCSFGGSFVLSGVEESAGLPALRLRIPRRLARRSSCWQVTGLWPEALLQRRSTRNDKSLRPKLLHVGTRSDAWPASARLKWQSARRSRQSAATSSAQPMASASSWRQPLMASASSWQRRRLAAGRACGEMGPWRSTRPRPASGRTSRPRSDWPPPPPSSPSLRRSSPAPPLGALVKARHLRPQAARSLAPDAQARILATVLDPGEPLMPGPPRLAAPRPPAGPPRRLPRRARPFRTRTASSRRRPTRRRPSRAEKAKAAVGPLASFPAGEVRTYLNTLWLQDPERWGALEDADDWLPGASGAGTT